MFSAIILPSSSSSSYSWNEWSVCHFSFTTKTTQPRAQVFSVKGALTCRSLHFWRHFLIKHKMLPNFVISNWLWWIMRVLLANQNWENILNEYSGTPPYDHPIYKTTSLLRPYSFKPNVKTIESFYYFEDPANATTSLLRPGFYGPTAVALTGFHCNKSHHTILCKYGNCARLLKFKNKLIIGCFYK